MSKKRMIASVGGTVACALSIGYFMQQEDSAKRPHDILAPAPIVQAVLQPVATEEDAPLDLQGITLKSALPEIPRLNRTAGMLHMASFSETSLPRNPSESDVQQSDCDVAAFATPIEMALVELSVSAPCLVNERATIHHNGMIFTDTTDASGVLNVSVPALAEKATFIVSFANGQGAVAQAEIAALANYDRVVLQWAGDSGFQIHAREFGAGYGEPGHIWAGVQKQQLATNPGSGFVTRLGDPSTMAPQLAEVYTFPSGSAQKIGTVALTVETEVTENNCGRDIAAQSIELRGSAQVRSRDIVMSMPECSAVGDFLVLNNLVDDLKIAAR